MKKFRKILSLLLAVLMLAAVLCACGDGEQPSAQPEDNESGSAIKEPVYGGEITVGIAQDLDDSLDPHTMAVAGTREVLFNVFEGLVKPDTDGNLIPAVASDYVIGENADTFTFTLREGVKFHDGSEVTVGDVVYSISRVAGFETGVPLVSTFSAVESVEAIDDKTVVVKTYEPYLEFLAFLNCAIIPEGNVPAEDGLIGTGPFKFVSRKAQENIIIEKFDDYWGEKAYLDKVTFKVIENGDTLVMSLKSGAVDVCAHLTSTQIAGLETDFNVLDGSMNLVQALFLNNAYEPLQDIRVRQALNYAVDRQMILDFVSDGKGYIVGSNMYPAFAKYYEDLTGLYPYNPEKAKSLLTEAGYPNGFDFVITVPSNYPFHVDTAQVIAEQLKAVGINCTIDTVEWGTWYDEVYKGRNYHGTIIGFDASDAMTAQSLLARYESTHSKNMNNYVSQRYDEVYNAALNATDEAEQVELYKQAQRILAEDASNVYLQDPCDFVAVRKGLEGYVFYPIYVMDLAGVHFTK
ncbi:MAG: ABC transporter substrate-binding protein [Oscillospiraceae bacterium]|nr:ABC transporter substrate-binding protein [Oscillospiraceae bacterium]